MIRLWSDLKRRRAEEDAANDALVERLHAAYRNTVDDGWDALLAKKRSLDPKHGSTDDRIVTTSLTAAKPHFPKLRVGFAIASCTVLIGASFLYAHMNVRPQGFWGSIPPPRLSIIGFDPLHSFTGSLLEFDGVIVPAGEYPGGISSNLAMRMEVAKGEDVLFIVRYVFWKDDGSLVVGVAAIPRDTIFEMARLGYLLTDHSFHR